MEAKACLGHFPPARILRVAEHVTLFTLASDASVQNLFQVGMGLSRDLVWVGSVEHFDYVCKLSLVEALDPSLLTFFEVLSFALGDFFEGLLKLSDFSSGIFERPAFDDLIGRL